MTALILALTLGCVPLSKYNTLQSQYESTQETANRLKEKLEAENALTQKLMSEFHDLMVDLKPLIDKGIVSVEMVDGRVVIGMDSDVLFSSGSAEMSAAGKQNLAELSRLLSRRAADHNFQIEGHTDSDPISSAQFPNNWYLGSARAIEVAEYMIAQGFPPDHLSASTYAWFQPVASNATPEGRRQNRRIEIVMQPNLGDLPIFQALQENAGKPRSRGDKK